jgi:hypothetical protein
VRIAGVGLLVPSGTGEVQMTRRDFHAGDHLSILQILTASPIARDAVVSKYIEARRLKKRLPARPSFDCRAS